MSQSTRQLVKKIQDIVSQPKAHWSPIQENIAKDYATLVGDLADRANVVEFQFVLKGTNEAKLALRHPTDLMEELRLLQFPTRTVWERLLMTRGINPRPLPNMDALSLLVQKINLSNLSKSGIKESFPEPPDPGEASLDDLESVGRRIGKEAGFAPVESSTGIRMLPLVLGIGAVCLGLLALAIFGPALMNKDGDQARGNPDAMDPIELMKARKEAEGANPGDNAQNMPEKGDFGPKKANRPNVDPVKEPLVEPKPKSKDPIPNKSLPVPMVDLGKDKPMEKAKEMPVGSVQLPQIAQLGELLDKNGDFGAKLKSQLSLQGDWADKKALDEFLEFVRSDPGLVGKKTLTLAEFLEMSGWQSPLSRDTFNLLNPDRLSRCATLLGAKGDEELSSWLASAILAPKAFMLVDTKKKFIHLETLLALAANGKIMADLALAIDKRVISERDPLTGNGQKVALRFEVALQQKRELKGRTNIDFAIDVTYVRDALLRRAKALGIKVVKKPT